MTRIFLSAGEASGDHYGAQLIASLKPSLPDAVFTGLGGAEMEAEGQQRVIRAEDVAVMGITEILRHIPRIYRSYRTLVRSIKKDRPDVAILIDFPDVNFRLAKHLRRMNVPVFWFVSPQLWAWKRQRLRWVQQRVTRMFVIFPFEQPFYKNRGVDAHYTGHPLADLPAPDTPRADYARHNSLDPAKQWIALLPGSRRKEVHANLPEMIAAARLLSTRAGYEFLLPLASTLPREAITPHLPADLAVHVVSDARTALSHARASVVASGTATVQAALIGNPFLVVYKVSGLTFRLAKWLIRYPAEIPTPKDEHGNLPIAMPNLIAGRRIVPELINKQMKSINIAETLEVLLEDSGERKQQLSDLATLRSQLKLDPERTAISHLHDAVLAVLQPAQSQRLQPLHPDSPNLRLNHKDS